MWANPGPGGRISDCRRAAGRSARPLVVGARSAVRCLATRLQELTETGELPPGTRLPAERRLAQALAVSRNTVAAAYQQLRDAAVAETRRGAGTMLAPPRPPIAGAHRTNALFASLLERHPAAVDLTCAAPSCPPRIAQVLARPADMLPAPLAAQLCDGIGYHPA